MGRTKIEVDAADMELVWPFLDVRPSPWTIRGSNNNRMSLVPASISTTEGVDL
jgi:hypothetical protein